MEKHGSCFHALQATAFAHCCMPQPQQQSQQQQQHSQHTLLRHWCACMQFSLLRLEATVAPAFMHCMLPCHTQSTATNTALCGLMHAYMPERSDVVFPPQLAVQAQCEGRQAHQMEPRDELSAAATVASWAGSSQASKFVYAAFELRLSIGIRCYNCSGCIEEKVFPVQCTVIFNREKPVHCYAT